MVRTNWLAAPTSGSGPTSSTGVESPLVVQLLIIAAVSGVIGEFKSTAIVGAMVVLSVGLSYILDSRSGRVIESLGKRVESRTLVLRDGQEREIKISEVVPGDIVILHAGSIIPADLRLLAVKDFFVSQSALSGESMAVEKTAEVTGSPGQVAGRTAPTPASSGPPSPAARRGASW